MLPADRGMTFRDAESSDCEALAQLHAVSWRRTYQGILAQQYLDTFAEDDRRLVWRARLSDPVSDAQLVRVAVNDDEIDGLVCLFLDEDERR